MNISSVNRNAQLARAASNTAPGFVAPNWKMIPHKGMPARPQAELKERAKELGYAFANAGSEPERRQIADEFFYEVQVQYASHVAPDRQALYQDAMETIGKYAGGANSTGKDIDTAKNIFDFITESKNRRAGMQFDKAYPTQGGGSVTATQVTGGGAHFEVKDASGQPALLIAAGCMLGNGVSYFISDAEQAANKEIAGVWQSAIDFAKAEKASGYKPEAGMDIKA